MDTDHRWLSGVGKKRLLCFAAFVVVVFFWFVYDEYRYIVSCCGVEGFGALLRTCVSGWTGCEVRAFK